MALLLDPALKRGTAQIIGWLKAVGIGKGAPQDEPEQLIDGQYLKYRCEGDVSMIFSLEKTKNILRILKFAAAASTLPKVEDMKIALMRSKQWVV